MDPKDAVKIMDNLIAVYKGTREEHAVLNAALEVLKALIPSDAEGKPE